MRFVHKLAVVALVPTATVLVVAGSAWVAYDTWCARRAVAHDASVVADFVGPLVLGALSSGGEPAVTSALAQAAASPQAIAASVYGPGGRELAAFQCPGPARTTPPSLTKGVYAVGDRVFVLRQLGDGGRSGPTLCIEHDATAAARRLEHTALMAASALGCALLLAFGLFSSLQSIVTRPIKHIAFTARMVSEARNFSVRARPVRDDELGAIIDGFNTTLDQIRERDEELRAVHQQLRWTKPEETTASDAGRAAAPPRVHRREEAAEPPAAVASIAPPAAIAAPRLPNGLCVLVAEDNPVNATLAQRLLEKHGCVVTLVGDGIGAVQAWKRSRVDVIVMDVMMPGVDGLEATRTIRSLEGDHARVPIIGLSGNTSEADDALFRDAGMDACLGKPLEIDALATAVAALLGGETRRAEPSVPAAETGAAGSPLDSRVIDRESLLIRLDGDLELLREMVDLFDARRVDLANEIMSALRNRDQDAFVRAVHTLKGTVANLGARGVFELAKELETLGQRGDLDAALERFHAFERELETFREALASVAESEAA